MEEEENPTYQKGEWRCRGPAVRAKLCGAPLAKWLPAANSMLRSPDDPFPPHLRRLLAKADDLSQHVEEGGAGDVAALSEHCVQIVAAPLEPPVVHRQRK